jgi:hypothetical protein
MILRTFFIHFVSATNKTKICNRKKPHRSLTKVDPQTNKEYAIINVVDGTSFVDVTDAQSPKVCTTEEKQKTEKKNANVKKLKQQNLIQF